MNSRMPLIDALKGIAAQVIVLHHLVSYGPISELMNRMLPALTEWLFDYGRMVVQVFLVVAGFLAARGLAPAGVPLVRKPGSLLWRRYLRLVRPFLVAMLLAIAGAALARVWMQSDAIPDAPEFWQFVAHGLLLHGIFGVPSLSAGVWYVAMDFQLYLLLLGLLYLARNLGITDEKRRLLSQLLVAALGIAALFYFNLDESLDDWGIYFFGAYALGVMSYWASAQSRSWLWLSLLAAVAVLALMLDFRLRIALALATALLLGISYENRPLAHWLDRAWLAYLGKISYSVFLVHFPLCLVVNAVFSHFTDGNAFAGMTAALIAWGGSILAGGVFYRLVESRQQWWPLATAPSKA